MKKAGPNFTAATIKGKKKNPQFTGTVLTTPALSTNLC
jgi:hypothetical protein